MMRERIAQHAAPITLCCHTPFLWSIRESILLIFQSCHLDLVSAPPPIVAAILVPLRRRLEIAGLQQMLFADVVVERNAKSRSFWHRNVALLNNWLGDTRDEVIPEFHICGMNLERQEVASGCSAMNVGHATDWAAGKVHRHCDTAFFGEIANLFGL